jgi:DNA-binding response OmpR family regulator
MNMDLPVLILEDEPIIAFRLEDLLLSMGWRDVLLALHLDEASRLLDDNDVGAAILDVNIHGKRSYPVAEELERRSIPYIFATGYGDTEHPPEFSGVPTVTKPYSGQAIADGFRLIAGR